MLNHNSYMQRFYQIAIELARMISILVMLGVLLHPLSSLAKVGAGLPSGLCGHTRYQCDKKTEQNWLLFQSSIDIQALKSNFISVGRCSRNGNYNSKVYVLLALTEKSDSLFFNAKLSFNNDLSIYKDFKFSKVSEIFPDIYDGRNLIIQSDTFAYIDYSKTGPFRYWLRYNQGENKMVMVAYFGYSDTLVCDFVMHPK